ncbi:MAG: hypothetical protein ABSB15_22855 [Bryobacteraceae bacterium]|jgi:hypothetical protein
MRLYDPNPDLDYTLDLDAPTRIPPSPGSLDPATRAFLAFTTPAEQCRVLENMYRCEKRCDLQYDRALTRLFEARKRRTGN